MEPMPEKFKESDVAICAEGCGWEGPIIVCESYEDSEGWEYPTYIVHICPECSKDITDYTLSPNLYDQYLVWEQQNT